MVKFCEIKPTKCDYGGRGCLPKVSNNQVKRDEKQKKKGMR